MNTHNSGAIRSRFSASAFAVIALAASLAFSGCSSLNYVNQRHDTALGKKRQVTNVHQASKLPEHLKRVAILPMHKGQYNHIDMTEIEHAFVSELMKRNLFEVVPVAPEAMVDMFTQERYSTVEFLPTKLLSKLHTAYAIDGVMLVDVSFFNAYEPIGLGVRAKLLDGHSGQLVWAADELFDSSSPATANAARTFYKTQSLMDYPLHDTRYALNSPSRFGKYVAYAVFNTISLQKN